MTLSRHVCADDSTIDYYNNKNSNNTNSGNDDYDADDGSNDNERNQYTLQQTLNVTNATLLYCVKMSTNLHASSMPNQSWFCEYLCCVHHVHKRPELAQMHI